jgi:hypothetical protein
LNKKRKYDAFICHASEDKKKVARPLAEELEIHGLRVWYDEFSLRYGDSLSGSIDYGLSRSEYGIVILSKKFFQKKWPRHELNTLISQQVRKNKRIILPIHHNISEDEIAKYSSIMADSYAAKSSEGIKNIAAKFYKHIRGIRVLYDFSSDTKLKNNISTLSKSVANRERQIKETEDEMLHIVLTKIYLITKGYRNAFIHFVTFLKSICTSRNEEKRVEKCINNMITQSLISSRALGTISITHYGIKKIERLLENSTRKSPSMQASQIRNSIKKTELANIVEIQKLRFEMLKRASSSRTEVANLFEIGKPTGIEREKLERVYFYLQDEELIEFYALGGDFIITNRGKELLSNRNLDRIL